MGADRGKSQSVRRRKGTCKKLKCIVLGGASSMGNRLYPFYRAAIIS